MTGFLHISKSAEQFDKGGSEQLPASGEFRGPVAMPDDAPFIRQSGPDTSAQAGKVRPPRLTLTIIGDRGAMAATSYTSSGGEFTVGRGADWSLPDAERVLSKRHFTAFCRDGLWQIADTSINGTYLNLEQVPIGRGNPCVLRDGDRLRLGNYEIEARIKQSTESQRAVDPIDFDALGPIPEARPDNRTVHDPPASPSLLDQVHPPVALRNLTSEEMDELLEGIGPPATGEPSTQATTRQSQAQAERRRRANANVRRVGRAAGKALHDASLEAYLERLLKLIPAEVVSIYPVGRSLIADDMQQGLWATICLMICVVFRTRMTRGPDGRPQWPAIAIAAVSFIIWVYVLGAHVVGFALPDQYKVWPALMLLAWTTIVPAVYTGGGAATGRVSVRNSR